MDQRPAIAWYCASCGRAIPVEDERRLEQDRRAHLEGAARQGKARIHAPPRILRITRTAGLGIMTKDEAREKLGLVVMREA